MQTIAICLKDKEIDPLRGSEYESQPDNMVKLSGFMSQGGDTLHTFYIPKANIQYIEVLETK